MIIISQEEYQQIRDLKELDIQQCSFCSKLNILNLGWKTFGKYWCEKEQKEHLLCPELCYRVCLSVLGCQLQQRRRQKTEEPIKPNRPYDWANCYGCSKELQAASKKGVIKNRNNPEFWGVSSSYKILCLGCIGKRFYRRMVDWQQKKFREYVRRGYV